MGTQKSGTTWWAGLLQGHPEVTKLPEANKELHFFNRFATDEWTNADVDEYHGWFARPPGQQAGEWTPGYMHDFWAPPLLKASAPDARILVLLRDPVERYWSGLSQNERAPKMLNPKALINDQVSRSRYGKQLERLHRFYPPDQVLILQFERCVVDPVGQYARTLAFLNLSPHVPPDVQTPVNQTVCRPSLPQLTCDLLVEDLLDDVRQVMTLCPELDPMLWPSLAGHLS